MKKVLLMIFMSLFLVGIVHAEGVALTCAIVEPDSRDTVTSNTPLNVSFVGGEGNSTWAVSFTFISPSTANSTVGNLRAPVVNLTGALLMANGSINMSFGSDIILEDASDYTVTASVNGTACSGTATNVIVDRTTPTAPSSITFSNPVEDGETITATVTGSQTTACYIRFGSPYTPRYTMTLSGSTCTFTPTRDNPPNGVYDAYFEAIDGKDSALSSKQNIEINVVKSDGGGLLGGAQISIPSGQTNNPLSPQGGFGDLLKNPIVILIGIGLIIYVVSNKK